jgi:hypothetical protein
MKIPVLILAFCLSVACAKTPGIRPTEKKVDPAPFIPEVIPEEAQLPFRLEIVPFPEKVTDWSVEYFDGRASQTSFQVILTNLSKFYQEHYSWGWENLSFEFRSRTGERYLFRKVPGAFTRNFPTTDTIQPGGRKVYSIKLDSSDWVVTPAFGRRGETKGTLKALYQVWPSSNGDDLVSTGWVESREYELTMKY